MRHSRLVSVLLPASMMFVRRVVVLTLACFATSVIATGARGDTHDHDNFREDAILCEEAIAHVMECCPRFDPSTVSCYHFFDSTTEGCHTTTSSGEPALTVAESRCILSLDCHRLEAAGCGKDRTSVCK